MRRPDADEVGPYGGGRIRMSFNGISPQDMVRGLYQRGRMDDLIARHISLLSADEIEEWAARGRELRGVE